MHAADREDIFKEIDILLILLLSISKHHDSECYWCMLVTGRTPTRRSTFW